MNNHLKTNLIHLIKTNNLYAHRLNIDGLSNRTIQKIIYSDVDLKLSNVLKICDFFNITLDQLVLTDLTK